MRILRTQIGYAGKARVRKMKERADEYVDDPEDYDEDTPTISDPGDPGYDLELAPYEDDSDLNPDEEDDDLDAFWFGYHQRRRSPKNGRTAQTSLLLQFLSSSEADINSSL